MRNDGKNDWMVKKDFVIFFILQLILFHHGLNSFRLEKFKAEKIFT